IKDSKEEGLNFEELEFQEKFIHLIEKKVKEHQEEVLTSKLNEVKDVIKEKWSEVMNRDIWSIEFDKNFIPSISYKDKTLTLRGLSGSEKIMLSVIMRAALMDKIMSRKTLILDDPSIFLDSDNIVKAAHFYQELIKTKQLSQIILTTFDERFMKELDTENVIRLD
ncbi:MAG: hypothetical protein GPJ51_01825, partial [Candidatus Heimdallarchaeota archaeon]|nr:hypothetical protein [Candidatus Heimdallarchaeota archaeon]